MSCSRCALPSCTECHTATLHGAGSLPVRAARELIPSVTQCSAPQARPSHPPRRLRPRKIRSCAGQSTLWRHTSPGLGRPLRRWQPSSTRAIQCLHSCMAAQVRQPLCWSAGSDSHPAHGNTIDAALHLQLTSVQDSSAQTEHGLVVKSLRVLARLDAPDCLILPMVLGNVPLRLASRPSAQLAEVCLERGVCIISQRIPRCIGSHRNQSYNQPQHLSLQPSLVLGPAQVQTIFIGGFTSSSSLPEARGWKLRAPCRWQDAQSPCPPTTEARCLANSSFPRFPNHLRPNPQRLLLCSLLPPQQRP